MSDIGPYEAGKLCTQICWVTQISSLNLRYFKVKEENIQEVSMTDIIMTREIIKIGIDQTAEIEKFCLVVEYSVDKITETGKGMNRSIGMTFGEEILEVMWAHIRIRIIEDRIIEVDIEETIGMRIMTEVEEGLEKGNIRVILEGTIEVVVDLGQDQEWVLIEI